MEDAENFRLGIQPCHLAFRPINCNSEAPGMQNGKEGLSEIGAAYHKLSRVMDEKYGIKVNRSTIVNCPDWVDSRPSSGKPSLMGRAYTGSVRPRLVIWTLRMIIVANPSGDNEA